MSEPELFVVCKNCSSEVSPYVTECPYCGQRVRKRAPKIEKGLPLEPPAGRRRKIKPPALPKLRRGEMPGIAPDTRPRATFGLIALSLLATLAVAADAFLLFDAGVLGPVGTKPWRLVTTAFLHDNLGYQFVSLLAVAIFGTHLERRFGGLAVVAIFLLSATAGATLSEAADVYPALGANGAALGLLCAWLVEDRRARGRGDDRDNDLLGVYVMAAVLLLLSLATREASVAAAVGGAAVGSLAGLMLATFRR